MQIFLSLYHLAHLLLYIRSVLFSEIIGLMVNDN
uniref:Uncharacterized protein n=1 Tax=Anguilla anguilla TaxID=7936 RepID=A0A0E9RY10_ANGAN